MKTRRSFKLLLCFAVGLLLITGCSGDNKKAIRTGDILTSFSGTDLNGTSFSLAAQKGKPAIVRFFLIDCPYCKADTPVFNEFYEKFHQKGLVIVYINNNGTHESQVREFVNELKLCINNNLCNPHLSVELLSDHFAISRTQLNRKIKSLTGQTPNNLIFHRFFRSPCTLGIPRPKKRMESITELNANNQ